MSCGPDVKELAMKAVERSRGSRQFIDHIWATRKEEKPQAGNYEPSDDRFRGRSAIDFDFSLKFLYTALSPDRLKRSTPKRWKGEREKGGKKKRKNSDKRRKQILKLKESRSKDFALCFYLFLIFFLSILYIFVILPFSLFSHLRRNISRKNHRKKIEKRRESERRDKHIRRRKICDGESKTQDRSRIKKRS